MKKQIDLEMIFGKINLKPKIFEVQSKFGGASPLGVRLASQDGLRSGTCRGSEDQKGNRKLFRYKIRRVANPVESDQLDV